MQRLNRKNISKENPYFILANFIIIIELESNAGESTTKLKTKKIYST